MRFRRYKPRTWFHPAQLEFRFELVVAPLCADVDEEDEDDEFDFPVHGIVSAAGLVAPVTRAPRSIFELAQRPVATRIRTSLAAPPPPPPLPQTQRQDGVTRCLGAAYPSRWTPEDEERERQRRARQKPPKPSKRARTKSRKLVELVGEMG